MQTIKLNIPDELIEKLGIQKIKLFLSKQVEILSQIELGEDYPRNIANFGISEGFTDKYSVKNLLQKEKLIEFVEKYFPIDFSILIKHKEIEIEKNCTVKLGYYEEIEVDLAVTINFNRLKIFLYFFYEENEYNDVTAEEIYYYKFDFRPLEKNIDKSEIFVIPVLIKKDEVKRYITLRENLFLEGFVSSFFKNSESKKSDKRFKEPTKRLFKEILTEDDIKYINEESEILTLIKRCENEIIEESREEGRKERNIEIARNLLDVLDNKTIAIKTGL